MAGIGARLGDVFDLKNPSRILPMEGVRGVAVTLVFFVHYFSCFQPLIARSHVSVAAWLPGVGRAGVDLFFVLSGYIIYGSILKARQFALGTFLFRRIRRIYPVFLVMLAFYLALSFCLPNESKLPAGGFQTALYIAANALLLPGIFDITPMITVAWSLSYEMFFYVALPVFVGALKLRERTRAQRIAVMSALAVALTAFAWLGGGRVQLVMFVAGILAFEAVDAFRSVEVSRSERKLHIPMNLLAVAGLPISWVIILLCESSSTGNAFILRTVWLFFAFGVAVFVAFRPGTVLGKICSITPLRALGNMSYSYYLMHGLALKALAAVGLKLLGHSAPNPWVFWMLMPLCYAATLIPSAVLYAAVEKRFSMPPVRVDVAPVRA
ncbi:MAG: acyltransferase family protein [Myxococcaceae bacterium]